MELDEEKKICVKCDLMQAQFRIAELLIKKKYANEKENRNTNTTANNDVDVSQAEKDEPKVKKLKKEDSPARVIGSNVTYLNRYSNKVETGTYLGSKNARLKLSIIQNNIQRFISIEPKFIIETDI